MGHGKIILQCDQEFAIVDLQAAIANEMIQMLDQVMKQTRNVRGLGAEIDDVNVVVENPPVGESQSNGAVENATERLPGQIRIVKM